MKSGSTRAQPIDLIAVLFLMLGDSSHAARESASTHLQALPVWHVCSHLDTFARHPDPEVRRRVQALREQHAEALTLLVLGDGAGGLPWIDSLPRDYPDRWQIIHGYLNAAGGDRYRVGEFPTYRSATAVWLRDRIADGMTLGDARALLGKMRARMPAWQGGKWTDE